MNTLTTVMILIKFTLKFKRVVSRRHKTLIMKISTKKTQVLIELPKLVSLNSAIEESV